MKKRDTSESARLFARARQLFPGGVNSPVRAFKSVGSDPFVVASGEGACLIDVDNNRYIDYINSWGPLVLGHAPKAVVDAISDQARRGTSFGASSALESDLAELIMGFFPSIQMMRFVNSGTEAGMAVLRVARAYTGRRKVLKFAGCYHGHADSFLVQAGSGALTLGLPDSPGVPASVAAETLTASFNDISSVKELFQQNTGEIAAVILEPVVGNAGFILPEGTFLQQLRALCSEEGALLIFDEVMTGFRVAVGGAQAVFGVTPDLTMLGKVIGGGLPVGAFGGDRRIMEQLAPLGPVYQAGTLSGNPLAMAAGLATLKQWTRDGVFSQVEAATLEIVRTLREEAERNGIPLTADSLGTMFGFFFQPGPVRNYEEAKRSNLEQFRAFFHLLLDRGVYIAPSQFEAGFVSAAHLGEPIVQTKKAISSAFAELAKK